ncbi:MAG TPA: MFS transporter [Verrucomicrobiae bacterium]
MYSPAHFFGTLAYNRLLLLVAGLGGLIYGIDVGIIAGALPYLEATFHDGTSRELLSAGQLSFIVAAVLLGGVFATLFAGLLADWFGRQKMLVVSGFLFVASVPLIALAQSYPALICGRLLQGISGAFIGVTMPLYLAECLDAQSRGRGTALFQWLLTAGIMTAALIGLYFSRQLDGLTRLADPAAILHFKDRAWRGIFWASLPPGILFVAGACLVAESPRWLYRRHRLTEARLALLCSRSAAAAEAEMTAMARTDRTTSGSVQDSLWQKKYILPFLLACLILACNQATGVNSVIGYSAVIFIQAGLSDAQAHLGSLVLTMVNFLVTIGAVLLVDRKGRKFLLSLGTAGVVIFMVAAGFIFRQSEAGRSDVKDCVQTRVNVLDQSLDLTLDSDFWSSCLGPAGSLSPRTMVLIYGYGAFGAASRVVRSDEASAHLHIDRLATLPGTPVAAFFKKPFASLAAARQAPLIIHHAIVAPVPSARHGWLVAGLLFGYMAAFAIGPGVCVWLALSELLPTRIRSNGMSVALLINVAISTAIAATFLPVIGQYGCSVMFFGFAGCTLVYFLAATFFLPETQGKTLEEIEAGFNKSAGGKAVDA